MGANACGCCLVGPQEDNEVDVTGFDVDEGDVEKNWNSKFPLIDGDPDGGGFNDPSSYSRICPPSYVVCTPQKNWTLLNSETLASPMHYYGITPTSVFGQQSPRPQLCRTVSLPTINNMSYSNLSRKQQLYEINWNESPTINKHLISWSKSSPNWNSLVPASPSSTTYVKHTSYHQKDIPTPPNMARSNYPSMPPTQTNNHTRELRAYPHTRSYSVPTTPKRATIGPTTPRLNDSQYFTSTSVNNNVSIQTTYLYNMPNNTSQYKLQNSASHSQPFISKDDPNNAMVMSNSSIISFMKSEPSPIPPSSPQLPRLRSNFEALQIDSPIIDIPYVEMSPTPQQHISNNTNTNSNNLQQDQFPREPTYKSIPNNTFANSMSSIPQYVREPTYKSIPNDTFSGSVASIQFPREGTYKTIPNDTFSNSMASMAKAFYSEEPKISHPTPIRPPNSAFNFYKSPQSTNTQLPDPYPLSLSPSPKHSPRYEMESKSSFPMSTSTSSSGLRYRTPNMRIRSISISNENSLEVCIESPTFTSQERQSASPQSPRSRIRKTIKKDWGELANNVTDCVDESSSDNSDE